MSVTKSVTGYCDTLLSELGNAPARNAISVHVMNRSLQLPKSFMQKQQITF